MRIGAVANRDRLTALDAAFLHLERSGAHMHVAAILVFEGEPPAYDELVEAIEARMHLVPRYRQKLAHVPLGQGRPVWVDDPHFNPRYHVRHSALPAPGSDEQLATSRAACSPSRWTAPSRCGRSTSSRASAAATASRSSRRPTTRSSTASAASTSPRCSSTPRPSPRRRRAEARAVGARVPSRPTPSCWPRRCVERATVPAEGARGLRALTRAPRQVARRRPASGSSASARWRGPGSARRRRRRSTCRSARTGATRGSTPTLARFKAIKNALGGTVNDVVLTAVALALGRFLRRRGVDTDGLVLKAMVPVSVRADAAARRARQPRRGDVGAAAGRRRRPRGRARARSPRRCAASRSPGRPSAPRR